MSSEIAPWHDLPFMRERLHAVSGRRLNSAANGHSGGLTILFLHGVLRNWRTFYHVYRGLNPDFGLLALDFRGHGKSDRAGGYLVNDYVEDVLALLRARPTGPLIVYGHSLGAMVALALAAVEPARVSGMILEDPPFSTLGAKVAGSVHEAYFRGVKTCLNGPRELDRLYHCFSEIVVANNRDGSEIRVRDQRDESSRRFSAESLSTVDTRVLDPILNGDWLAGYDFAALARKTKCPALLLQADSARGGMLPDTEVSLLGLILGTRCQLRYFAGVGHQLHGSVPTEIVELIRGMASTL